MAFKDYSTTPALNTTLADGTYIGPNMLRNKVRPALQQLAADGKALSTEVTTANAQNAVNAAAAAASAAAAANSATSASVARDATLASGTLYASTAAGLAATAEGGYFMVAGSADVYATLYRETAGAAVSVATYPSAVALNRVGTAAAVVVNDLTVDNAIAINAALADPTVRVVILPAGIIYTRQLISVPEGKTLQGSGKNVTIITAHPTIFAGAGGFQAIVRSAQGAKGVTVRDLTVNGNKNSSSGGQKGVMMYEAQDFLVENVEARNCRSYNFWAMALASGANSARGVFRNLRSYNCNVHFEVTNARGVLWDNCVFGTGDGDIGSEAVYHVLAGSQNITYRDCRGEIASGHLVSIIANEANTLDNIRLIRCDGASTGDNVAILTSKTHAGATFGKVTFEDCNLSGTKQAGAQLSAGTIKFSGGRIEGLSTGIQVDPLVTLDVDGTDIVSNTTGAITAFGVANNGGIFRMRGGSITPNSTQSSVHLTGGGSATITRIDRNVQLSGLTDGIRIITASSNHDLEAVDQNRDILLNGGVSQQVRIFPDASLNLPVGTRFRIIAGDGTQKSVLPETGVTVNGGAAAVTFTGAFKELNVLKTAANTWVASVGSS